MKLWIAAAEASGDRLGGDLAAAVMQRGVHDVRGLAGPHMRSVGVRPVADAESATAMGLVEVVGAVPRIARLLSQLDADLAADPPDLLVTVDSPELMLRLATRARRRQIPVVHWVCPQLWAWRPGRVHHLAQCVDTVMCLLPFEPDHLAGRVRGVFVGHPAAATVAAPGAPRPGTPTIALCPGSRPGEVARHWPVLREVARIARRRWPRCGFVVPEAPTVQGQCTGLDAIRVEGIAACAGADVAVVASGTATLQLAALGVPMVVIYRVHPVTWEIARRWVRGVDHVALPNLVAGGRVVPEILQDLDPEALCDAMAGEIGARQVPEAVLAGLIGDRAIDRAADEVMAWLTPARRPRSGPPG